MPAPQNCTGGYTDGTVVQVDRCAEHRLSSRSWSGAASGTTNPVSVTMDGDKSVTANFTATLGPISPSGTLTSWDKTFSWTGLSDATWYLLEVQTSGGTQVFRKWYTSAQTGCSGGTACSVTPAGLSLANGDYKWRVMDYGAYGYGTNSAFMNFTLEPGLLHADDERQPGWERHSECSSAENCAGGYTAGSVVQLTAVPDTGYAFRELERGCERDDQPGLGDDGWEQERHGQLCAATRPIAPSGTLTSWDNTFSWTGLSDATWYLLEVQTSGGHAGLPPVVHQHADGLLGRHGLLGHANGA